MAETITRYDNTYDNTTRALDEDDAVVNDGLQHGIDNDPTGDAEKGATAGGIGGVIVGALAGAPAGPLGMVAGAIIGGVAGGVASGAAVAAIDRHDNDNTVTGLGSTPDPYLNSSAADSTYVAPTGTVRDTYTTGNTFGDTVRTDAAIVGNTVRHDAAVVGSAIRSDYDTVRDDLRGDTATLRNNVNNDVYGARSSANSGIGTGLSTETEVGERHASFKTGGVANDGTPDTRGIGEKIVDGLTGDDVDDKTGSVVNHP